MINTQTSLSFKLIFKCKKQTFFLYVLKQNTLNIILKETFNFLFNNFIFNNNHNF